MDFALRFAVLCVIRNATRYVTFRARGPSIFLNEKRVHNNTRSVADIEKLNKAAKHSSELLSEPSEVQDCKVKETQT